MIGKEFLPITREECDARGWGQVDFVYVTGDAYVDHPSFGAAIITRLTALNIWPKPCLSQSLIRRGCSRHAWK